MAWRALLHGDPVAWLLADRMPSRVEASTWLTLQAATVLKHTFREAAA